jgi:hypothetical protein
MVTPLYEAAITTAVGSATLEVSILKLACVAPAATTTESGTFATEVLLLESEILAPPDGASAARTTVPSGCACPCTDDAPSEILVSAADVGAGAFDVDVADATVLGAAGDEPSPHAADQAADATTVRRKNLRSGSHESVRKTCRIEASSGGTGPARQYSCRPDELDADSSCALNASGVSLLPDPQYDCFSVNVKGIVFAPS